MKQIREFKRNGCDLQGHTNDPILGVAIAGSNKLVGMNGFLVALTRHHLPEG